MIDDRRKVEQIPVLDSEGRISYYKIPNYTLRNEFITNNERNFMRLLINVVQKLNEEIKKDRVFLQISTQVALNRIIDINNRRNQHLYDEIKNKSIDYVIYDLNTGRIVCCIELDGKEHIEDSQRKERDKLLSKMLNNLVKIIHVKSYENYTEEGIMNLIRKIVSPQ